MKNETTKGRLLRSSILAGVAVSMATVAAPAFAQEDGVEEIFVTGSRIAQTSYDGPNPVIVFTAEEIEKQGEISVADVLRQSTLNSFGSFSERSGSSWQSQATISLRGFGSARTLITIDGQRVAASPKMGGAAVNLNTIPTAAIERVDVLTGAASSIYGSDAAAGVVNVILRDSYDGITVTGMKTHTAEEGGEEQKISLVTGFESDRARVMFALDHQERDIIYLGDRWYGAATGHNEENYDNTTGISVYSANYRSYNDSTIPGVNNGQFYPLANCPGDSRLAGDGQIYFAEGSGHVCGFDYTAIMAEHASRQYDSAISNFSYDVTDDIEFNLRMMHSRGETFGRYAPVAARYPAPAGTVDFLVVNGGDSSSNGAIVPATNDTDGYVYKRFIDSGPRVTETRDYSTDILMKLDGQYSDYNWNLTANYNKQQNDAVGSGYINREIYTKALDDPSVVLDIEGNPHTVFDPSHPDFVAYYGQTISDLATSDYFYFGGGIGGPVAFVPGLDFFGGAEFYEYEFVNDYDDQSAAGNVMGSAGNDESGEREVAATYVEFQYNEVDNLVLNGSARYDSYSDFGNVTTYKVSGVYDIAPVMGISEDLSFRASYGTGFIAPSLGIMYQAISFSAEDATDTSRCEIHAIACSSAQVSTYIYGNEDLEAETSTNFTAGLMGTLLEGDIRLRADYFMVEVENVVGQVSVQDLLDMEYGDCMNGTSNLAALTASPVFQLDRIGGADVCTVNAGIDGDVLTSYDNDGSVDSSGVDLSATLLRDYDFGSFTFKADGTYVFEYNAPEYYRAANVDFIGAGGSTDTGLPQWRGMLSGQFERGDHALLATVNHIDSYTIDNGDEIGAWTTYDLRYTWQSPWDATVSVGCRNCTNMDPELDSGMDYNEQLHNIYGQVSYVSITANF